MAGAAEFTRNVAVRDDLQGLVGRVTFRTIGSDLGLLVAGVAVKTTRDLFMAGMTAVAEQPGMPAGCRRHLLSNFAVA